MKPLIKLYDSVGLGIIISYPTNIIISNQTGGTACLQPELEGFFLPIGNDLDTFDKLLSPELDLAKYFTDRYYGTGAISGLDCQDIEKVNEILSKYRLDVFINIDNEKAPQSHEAWIYVKIHTHKAECIKNLEGTFTGVLTWANSD